MDFVNCSLDNTIGIYGGVNLEDKISVYHDNQTGRWISTFRCGFWGSIEYLSCYSISYASLLPFAEFAPLCKIISISMWDLTLNCMMFGDNFYISIDISHFICKKEIYLILVDIVILVLW